MFSSLVNLLSSLVDILFNILGFLADALFGALSAIATVATIPIRAVSSILSGSFGLPSIWTPFYIIGISILVMVLLVLLYWAFRAARRSSHR